MAKKTTNPLDKIIEKLEEPGEKSELWALSSPRDVYAAIHSTETKEHLNKNFQEAEKIINGYKDSQKKEESTTKVTNALLGQLANAQDTRDQTIYFQSLESDTRKTQETINLYKKHAIESCKMGNPTKEQKLERYQNIINWREDYKHDPNQNFISSKTKSNIKLLNSEVAYTACSEALALNPEPKTKANFLSAKANILNDNKQYKDAINLVDKNKDDVHPDLAVQKLRTQIGMKQYKEAEKTAQEIQQNTNEFANPEQARKAIDGVLKSKNTTLAKASQKLFSTLNTIVSKIPVIKNVKSLKSKVFDKEMRKELESIKKGLEQPKTPKSQANTQQHTRGGGHEI